MRKFIKLLFTFVFILSLTSCATIFSGTKDSLTFNTKQEGAKLYHKGIDKCTLPCTIKMKRSLGDDIIVVKKDGYEDRMFELDKKFNAVSIINLFSLVGWGVDAATGALMKYDQTVYDIELEKKGVGDDAKSDGEKD